MVSKGKTVSRHDLSRVLSPVLLKEFDQAWKFEKSSRKEPKSLELVKYEALLKKGLLAFGQYEAKHKVLTSYQSKKMNQSAESLLEKALLYAVELIQNEPELIVWFDRDPRYGPDAYGFAKDKPITLTPVHLGRLQFPKRKKLQPSIYLTPALCST